MHGILIRAELAGGALIDKDGMRLLVAARKVHSKLTQRRVVTLQRNSTATGAGWSECQLVCLIKRTDIHLDYSARLELTLQHQCTAAVDLDDPVQLRLVPQYPCAAVTSSTTSTSRG
jgi:hypothetical protein